MAYAALGDARKAIEYYEQALAIAREIGDRRGEGNCAGQPGHGLRRPWATPARPSSTTSRRWPSLVKSGTEGAKVLRWATWAVPTPTWATPARPSSTTSRRWSSPVRSGTEGAKEMRWATWASPTPTLGDARKAIEYYEQALAIAREIGDRRGEGTALGNLGLAYAALGDARKAIEYYEQALAIAREIGDRRGEGACAGQPGHAPTPTWATPARPSNTTSSTLPSPARSGTEGAKEMRYSIPVWPSTNSVSTPKLSRMQKLPSKFTGRSKALLRPGLSNSWPSGGNSPS